MREIIRGFWLFLSRWVSCTVDILVLPYVGIGREYHVFYCWRNGSDRWDHRLVFRTTVCQWADQTKIFWDAQTSLRGDYRQDGPDEHQKRSSVSCSGVSGFSSDRKRNTITNCQNKFLTYQALENEKRRRPWKSFRASAFFSIFQKSILDGWSKPPSFLHSLWRAL